MRRKHFGESDCGLTFMGAVTDRPTATVTMLFGPIKILRFVAEGNTDDEEQGG